jgi:hypothetical protein
MLYASFGVARWQGALLALHDILVATWSRICSVHTKGIVIKKDGLIGSTVGVIRSLIPTPTISLRMSAAPFGVT